MEKSEAMRLAGDLALKERPELAGRMKRARRDAYFRELAESWDLWYDLYYDNDPPGMSRAEYGAVTEKEAERLRAWLPPRARLLDLGCGDGRILRLVAPACREAHGADISPKALARAKGVCRGLSNVRLHVVTGPELAFPGGSLDFVYCHLMLSQLDAEPVLAVFKEAARVLAPGGRFFFDLPNMLDEACAGALLDIEASNWPGINRPRYWTAESVGSFLVRCGFAVESLAAGRWIEALAVKA